MAGVARVGGRAERNRGRRVECDWGRGVGGCAVCGIDDGEHNVDNWIVESAGRECEVEVANAIDGAGHRRAERNAVDIAALNGHVCSWLVSATGNAAHGARSTGTWREHWGSWSCEDLDRGVMGLDD